MTLLCTPVPDGPSPDLPLYLHILKVVKDWKHHLLKTWKQFLFTVYFQLFVHDHWS